MADHAAMVGDSRFFQRTGPHTLAAVVDAARVDGVPADAPPRRLMLHGIAPLATATETEVAYCQNHRKYRSELAVTKAAAVIVHPDMVACVPETAIAIVSPDPQVAFARVAAMFHPLPPLKPGVHPTAIVAESARVDPTAEVGPFVVIGENATIAAYTRIAPFVSIGDGVSVGRHTRIASHASASHALIGDRVYIYPGVRIGQDGFGFAVTSEGFLTVPQVGRVIIGDDVEVGANTTIDRGALEDTIIGAGTRIDNLVQIGHNVRVGRSCVIVAQVGIAGSTVVEDQVMIGGQAGIAGHLRIGRGARIAATSGVGTDVPAGAAMAGVPAQPAKQFFKELTIIRRMVRCGGPGAAAGKDKKSDVD